MRDPHFGQIAQTVVIAARARSPVAMVANMERDPQKELTMIRELWEHRANGIILWVRPTDLQRRAFSHPLRPL
jgi:DNA-binding LacI/PurR family transcriptional regulator